MPMQLGAFSSPCRSGVLFWIWLSVVVATSQGSSALLRSDQTEFIIGGWISSPPEKLLHDWSPVFETYLTEEVGKLYDPPIKFTLVPMDYEAANEREVLIAQGKLDFAFQTGGGLTCLEAQHEFSTIATQVTVVDDTETACYGSVIYTLKSNTAVSDVSKFKGKRLGVGYPLAPGGFQLGAQYLDEIGLNIYTAFSQVVFYMTDYEGLMNGILLGDVDVGITQSGWLEAHFPEFVPKFKYHNLRNATFHSAPYAIPTTTDVVPAAGLSSAPHIPIPLQMRIFQALSRLTRDHPAARAAGIARFILPESYEPQRKLVERLGLIDETPAGKTCRHIFEGLDKVIVCPAGFALEQPDALAQGCTARRAPCPAGRACFCRPCHPDIYVNIFPWQLVLGLCCSLFAVGLCFSVGWSTLLKAEVLAERLGYIPRLPPAGQRPGRAGGAMMAGGAGGGGGGGGGADDKGVMRKV